MGRDAEDERGHVRSSSRSWGQEEGHVRSPKGYPGDQHRVAGGSGRRPREISHGE